MSFPNLHGPIGLRELGAARKLLKQGLELDRKAMLRIVDRAIELVVTDQFQHADHCAWWFGAGCDALCRNGGDEDFDPSDAERPRKARR